MTHTDTVNRTAPARSGPKATPGRPILLVAALSSATLTAVGLWNAAAGYRLFADPDTALIAHWLPAPGSGRLLIALGVAGLLVALLAALQPRPGGVTPVLTVIAGAEVLGLGVAFQSVSTISLAGYLVALVLPLGLIWIAVQVVRRYRRVRWLVLAAVLAAAVWGGITGALRPDTLRSLAVNLGRGFAGHADQLLMVLLLGFGTTCWVLVTLRLLRHGSGYGAFGGWVQRHRRGLTILAALGPVPYALIRATWLTPWPQLTAGAELEPEMRLWGLLLGGGAALGSILTIGLIRPWGEVFPRWMPWLGGREVPVAAAVVPGGLVAGVLCASAIPMLQLTLSPLAGTVFSGLPLLQELAAMLIFPFWVWGPALALAVWGYALARRDQATARANRGARAR
ncbi:MAG: hypothetical protein ABWX96_12790 [Propionibacteriaceae bacterium]